MRITCGLPLLPRKRKRTELPDTSTWRLRSVVSPYERFLRAYSSLPTRMHVTSRRRTIVASTFSRGTPGHARVLRLVTHRVPPRVVAVLLSAARVAAGRLDVAVRERADPDLLPRGRNGERADARERRLVVDRLAARGDVREIGPAADPLAANPRPVVVDVPQPRALRAELRIDLAALGHPSRLGLRARKPRKPTILRGPHLRTTKLPRPISSVWPRIFVTFPFTTTRSLRPSS